ncbi:MAG TPA: hypothetical protein VGK61_01035, partial [Planctomycetota bacterium]
MALRWILAAALVAVMVPPGTDTSAAREIAIQHEGRVKPFDTFARQLIQFLTEKENFRGYTDPDTGTWVEVFPDGDPVRAVLRMVADPRGVHSLRFIKVTHPELKKHFGLEEGRTYFSLADLESARGKLTAEARQIDEDTATSRQ